MAEETKEEGETFSDIHRLGKLAGLLGGVEDLVVEDREI